MGSTRPGDRQGEQDRAGPLGGGPGRRRRQGGARRRLRMAQGPQALRGARREGPARGAPLRPSGNGQDDARARCRRPRRRRLLRGVGVQLRGDVRRSRRGADQAALQGGSRVGAGCDLHRRARRRRRQPRLRRGREQRARAGPQPAAGGARRLRARPGHRDRPRRLQLRGQARQGPAAAGPLRSPGPGRAARPRRARGDPAHPRQGQDAGGGDRPARCRAQDDGNDRRPALQRPERSRDHRRPGGPQGDRPRGPRRGAAAPVGRLAAGAPPE